MATTSQELHINHSYAKESKDVGEEIGGLLVTGILYNVPERHYQSSPHLLRLKQMRKKTDCWEFSFSISVLLGGFNLWIGRILWILL